MPNSTTNTLNRWLDRNPKGPLTRTRNFITIPAFNIPCPWLGYSDIVGIFDYTTSHSFTIKDYTVLDNDTNCSLMVSYVTKKREVKRYRLTEGMGEEIFFDIPQYDGQVIKPLFRIEIWSTPAQLASQLSDEIIITSVLNDVDYRYGADTELDTDVRLSTIFGSILGAGVISASPNLTNLAMWFDGSGINQAVPSGDLIVGEGPVAQHIIGDSPYVELIAGE